MDTNIPHYSNSMTFSYQVGIVRHTIFLFSLVSDPFEMAFHKYCLITTITICSMSVVCIIVDSFLCQNVHITMFSD